jgi:peptidoglycan/LPS O-acetylase OafA/YrhL
MRFFTRQQHCEQHLHTLDGVRALSILFVIIFHAFFFSQYAFENEAQFLAFSDSLPFWLAWVRRGDLGVDIFFVLSAFLIGTQLFCEEHNAHNICLKRFYWKRFFRIYPVYLFALLLFVAAKGWDWNILGNVFAFNNLFNIKDIVIPWSWSLSVEIQFYAVFPLLILAIRRPLHATLFCVSLLILSISWMCYFYFSSEALRTNTMMDFILNKDKDNALHYMQYLYISPIARLPSFVFGIAAAWLWVYKRDIISAHYEANRSKYCIATGLIFMSCLALGSFNIYQPMTELNGMENLIYSINMVCGRMLFSLLIAALITISLMPKTRSSFTQRFLSHPLLFPIARGSYSMYLFHPYLLFLAYFVLFGEEKLTSLSVGGLLALAALGIVFAFIFSLFTYYAIEKWFTYSRFFGKKESKVRDNASPVASTN